VVKTSLRTSQLVLQFGELYFNSRQVVMEVPLVEHPELCSKPFVIRDHLSPIEVFISIFGTPVLKVFEVVPKEHCLTLPAFPTNYMQRHIRVIDKLSSKYPVVPTEAVESYNVIVFSGRGEVYTPVKIHSKNVLTIGYVNNVTGEILEFTHGYSSINSSKVL
jgi:hypothetical protein